MIEDSALQFSFSMTSQICIAISFVIVT